MQGPQIEKSPIKKFSTARKFSMPTLITKIKQVVLVKYEFQYREKLKLKCFLWNFRTAKILMQGEKQWFPVEYLSTSAVFSTEILMEEIELVVAES